MQFKRVTLANCEEAIGVVIVIDVLRAFTTAAYALARGAARLVLVKEVGEALALRQRYTAPFLQRVRDSINGQNFLHGSDPHFLAADVDYAVDLDRFNFAMQVTRVDGLHVLCPLR